MNMLIQRENDAALDELEALMIKEGEAVECPIVHLFTDGMYVRQMFVPKGSLITSRIHKTEHPYTVSLGALAVSIDGGEWDHIVAPHTGITIPGTRRVAYILEDCIWTTYHPVKEMKSEFNNLSEEEIEKIVLGLEDKLLIPHINQLTGGDIHKEYKNILQTKKSLEL
jgi:hypothetical protein